MRVVFWGTPEFACDYITALAEGGHEVAAIVCQPDRPRGRGRRLAAPPTKEAAVRLGLPVLQPEDPSDPQFIAELKQWKAEVFVVVAYGRILGAAVLAIPPKGCVNVHYSLLPKYRGAAPVAHAIINGETTTGVTVMFMSERMDAGEVILQRRVPIEPDDTAGTLLRRLTDEGVLALREALELVARGTAPRIPQDESAATYAPALRKMDGLINWSLPAHRLVDFVRGLNPWPVAFTYYRGEPLRVLKARVVKEFCGKGGSPGQVVEVRSDAGILVQAGDGVVALECLQPAGRPAMSSAAFARGRQITVGELMG